MHQLGVILGVVAIGGGLLVYALLFLRNGREYREALNEVYVRDPDDLGVPPAVAGYVNRFYELRGDDLAATAMDLVARGVVDLDDDPAYRVSRSLLSLRRERAAGLWPHELAALALLLAPCGRLCPLATLDVLRRTNWRDRQVYDERIGEFGRCVIEEVDDLGLAIEPYGFRAAVKVSVVALAMVLVGFAASGLTGTWVFEVAAMVLAGAAFVFDRVMYRRSQPGRILQVRCGHLRRYWHDFGHLGEKHLDEVALWGRHLAFAVALGDATLARRELHDDYERLGRLAESLMIDDQELYLAHDNVGDGRIAEWLRTLGLPEKALIGMGR
jgi:hypothetical protein